jgi:hypothetical protein
MYSSLLSIASSTSLSGKKALEEKTAENDAHVLLGNLNKFLHKETYADTRRQIDPSICLRGLRKQLASVPTDVQGKIIIATVNIPEYTDDSRLTQIGRYFVMANFILQIIGTEKMWVCRFLGATWSRNSNSSTFLSSERLFSETGFAIQPNGKKWKFTSYDAKGQRAVDNLKIIYGNFKHLQDLKHPNVARVMWHKVEGDKELIYWKCVALGDYNMTSFISDRDIGLYFCTIGDLIAIAQAFQDAWVYLKKHDPGDLEIDIYKIDIVRAPFSLQEACHTPVLRIDSYKPLTEISSEDPNERALRSVLQMLMCRQWTFDKLLPTFASSTLDFKKLHSLQDYIDFMKTMEDQELQIPEDLLPPGAQPERLRFCMENPPLKREKLYV